MDDPCGRGDHPEVGKCLLAPLEELVSLLVPLEFPPAVDDERIRAVERIDLNRVVDHEITRARPG